MFWKKKHNQVKNGYNNCFSSNVDCISFIQINDIVKHNVYMDVYVLILHQIVFIIN